MVLPKFMKYLDLLRSIYRSNPVKLEYIIQHLDPEVIKSIAEIALNILKGVVKLNPQRFKSLKRLRGYIKDLAKRSISLSKKRSILANHPELVSQLLGALFSRLFKR